MSNQAPSEGGQVLNAVKFLADTAVLPGSSQLIEGSVGAGLAYSVAGIAAKAIAGPWLWVGVGLDSYSKSASGKHLWEHFNISKPRADKTPTPELNPEPVKK
jgi:hypothetical protein